MKYLLHNQETERIRFRSVALSDFKDWLTFFKDPTIAQYWKGTNITPEKACEAWYDRQFEYYGGDEGGMNALVEKSSGRFIGHCGLSKITLSRRVEMELSFCIVPEFRGKGYGLEAAKKCKYVAFENDFASSLIALISVNHQHACNVAFRNGMMVDMQLMYGGLDSYLFRITHKQWLDEVAIFSRNSIS